MDKKIIKRFSLMIYKQNKHFKSQKNMTSLISKKYSFVLFLMFLVTFKSLAQDSEISRIKADVLKAMGGQKAYDKTRYISWNFFGGRNLIWDKHENRVRIDLSKENTTYILNIGKNMGMVLKDGVEVTGPDSVAKYLESARKTWINDSYWLVMPFKLSDSGVTLKYLGDQKTEDGSDAEVLEMTFTNVGVTPENKYHVFFDKNSHLVSQWSYFANFADEKPRFTMPWKDYKSYGKIMLSGNRGVRQLSDIKVFDKLPETVFNTFTKPDFLK